MGKFVVIGVVLSLLVSQQVRSQAVGLEDGDLDEWAELDDSRVKYEPVVDQQETQKTFVPP